MRRKAAAVLLVAASVLGVALALRDEADSPRVDGAALVAATRDTLECAPDEIRGHRSIDYARPVGAVPERSPDQVVAEYLGNPADPSGGPPRSPFRVIRRGEGYRLFAPRDEGRIVRFLVVIRNREFGWRVSGEQSCSRSD